MGDKRNVYRNLLGKPEGMSPLGRPYHRQKDNIEIYFKNRVEGYEMLLFVSGQEPVVSLEVI
jgi:hypothetical protein